MTRIFAALAFLFSGLIYAQEFPARTVRIVVPFTPAGPVDILGRVIAERLAAVFSVEIDGDALDLAAGQPEEQCAVDVNALGPTFDHRAGTAHADMRPARGVAVGPGGGDRGITARPGIIPRRAPLEKSLQQGDERHRPAGCHDQ